MNEITPWEYPDSRGDCAMTPPVWCDLCACMVPQGYIIEQQCPYWDCPFDKKAHAGRMPP